MTTIVYPARRIYTMNPSQPIGDCLAVRDGRILSVASLEEISRFGDFTIDERFADKVLMPGLVEGHSHALEGAIWDFLYLGWFDKTDPDGRRWPGLREAESVQQALSERLAQQTSEGPLIAWGFDPVYFDGERIDRRLLDDVSRERPIVIVHASLHVMTVNSAVIESLGLDVMQIDGIVRDSRGQPTGDLLEFPAMHPVFDHYGIDLFGASTTPHALRQYARAARREGITTITDMLNPMSKNAIESMRVTTAEPGYPVRLVPALNALSWDPEEGSACVQRAMAHNHDKLHFGIVKIVTDGAIQNFTARLQWPGYLEGPENGVWNAPPETFHAMVQHYHQAGLQLHIHTNGDEAVQMIIEALEDALAMWPRPDHRHTLQHVQLIRQSQLRRVKSLGACLNIFANHIYYWGDIHRTRTLGFDRCQRLEPVASADRLGITFGIHCDAPVTPLSPLFTAHCAHTRETASGVVLGREEAISRARALHAITLGAAETLHLDHCIGSLETGKWADVAILDDDPMESDKLLKDIGVHATMLGGWITND